ncbi:serine hydrolase [Streptomyces sp. SID3343]|nr:serine hydrolase [Streptomyces sp. SID3343]MYW00569.1 serine hydrolase [Streptomyces sp. SID3343]
MPTIGDTPAQATTTGPGRKRRHAVIAALAGLLVAVPSTAVAGTAGQQPTQRRQLQREVERVLREGGYVNAAIELRDGNRRVEAHAGVADLRTGRAVLPGGELRIASATKTLVATVALQLVAEGRLSLDDSVEKWLPGVVLGNGNEGSRITIRNLLQHTSGLHNYSEESADTAAGFEAARFRRTNARRLVADAMTHAPSFPPASTGDPEPNWEYSNTNYVLTGMVIERVTGRSWRTEVRHRIIRPLGLTGTYAPEDDPTLPGPYTHSYHRFADEKLWLDTTIRSMSWGDAAGELVSTHDDVNHFFTALIRGRLLPPAQLALMLDTVAMPADFDQVMPGVRDGLGLMSQPLPCGGLRWGHGGDLPGSKVRTGVTQDGSRSVVVVLNGTYEDDEHGLPAETAAQQLLDRVLCAKS